MHIKFQSDFVVLVKFQSEVGVVWRDAGAETWCEFC